MKQTSKKRSRRVKRSKKGLIDALVRHLHLLETYVAEVCKGDQKYLGEVAGKLRLLVHDRGCNTPLLLGLMKEDEFEKILRFDGPGGGRQVEFKEYLQSFGGMVKLEDGTQAKMTNIDVVLLWAQQAGASHEDWEHDERLVQMLECGILINNVPMAGQQLLSIARNTLNVSYDYLRFLGILKPDG